MRNLLADIVVGDITPNNAIEGGASSGGTFNQVISGAIGLMTIIAGIWFVFQIIIGGIAIINSNGDSEAVAKAKQQITNGAIGLVIVIAAVFITGLAGFIFGIEILNPASNIESIRLR